MAGMKKAIIIIICFSVSFMAGCADRKETNADYMEKSEIIEIETPDIANSPETVNAKQDREESADTELFSRNLELLIENEKAICIYEGTIDFDKEYDKFAIYKETEGKDIVFVNMLFVQKDSWSIYTWKGEDFIQVGIWENDNFQYQDILESEGSSDLLYENITEDELLGKVMEVLKENENNDLKLIYDGVSDFLNKKYYVISSFDDFEDHIIRTQTYYVDMENGNVYRADEVDEFLRTELYYAGSINQ